ncbi:MAG TPA: hypothetical protein VJ774_04680 [Actinomycetota bacterium]|nr:hypothetical protein [Actinomycetota bacterium]
MRWPRAFAIAILASVLVLTTAIPTSAATRIRVYRGETSQEHVIKFQVARTDAGRRYLREVDARLTITCEDGTTQSFGAGWGFGGPYVRIAEGGAFSFEDVGSYGAFRLGGRLGSQRGEGTFSYTFPALTEDEQAQLCTTGDLTWTAEYVRSITRPRV